MCCTSPGALPSPPQAVVFALCSPSSPAGLDGQSVDCVGFLAGLPLLPWPEPPLLPALLPPWDPEGGTLGPPEGQPEGGTALVATALCKSPRSRVSAALNKESKFCSISSILDSGKHSTTATAKHSP